MVGSKKWMWCQKCNNNKGRWTLSHTTEDHKDDYQKKSSSNSNNSVDQPKPKATAVTTAEEPGETDLGVWCTALELNSNNYPPFSVIMMYILLGVCIGIFAINKSYKVFAAVSPHSPKALAMWPNYQSIFSSFWSCFSTSFAIHSFDMLVILRYVMVLWCGYFVSYGSIPIDNFLEHYLTRGREMYSTTLSFSSIIFCTILGFLKFIFACFIKE